MSWRLVSPYRTVRRSICDDRTPVAGVHGIWNYGYQRKAAGDLPAAVRAISPTGGLARHGLGEFDLTFPSRRGFLSPTTRTAYFVGWDMGVAEPGTSPRSDNVCLLPGWGVARE